MSDPEPSAVARGGSDANTPEHASAVETATRRVLEGDSTSVVIATVLLVVVIGILHPTFLSASQLKSVLQEAVYVGIIATGMAFLVSMRDIDLSVGGNFSLSVIIAALFMSHGMNPWLAALLALGAGATMGLFNALLAQGIAIPTIIVTLATQSMFFGLATALAHGQPISEGLPLQSAFFTVLGGSFAGFPVSVWLLLGVVIVLTLILRFTPFGYRVRAIGSNPDAATFSGIPVRRVRIQTLVMIGLLCGFAGMLGLAYFETGDPNVGTGFELQAIAAAVIGGTPLRGGSATVFGAAVGAILLSAVTSGLTYFNVPVNWSSFATGATILAAVALDSLVRSRRRARRRGLGL